jgi:cytochrome c553
MPAWPAQLRHDEVWSVVAFLQEYRHLDVESYRALAGFPAAEDSTAAPDGPAAFSEALTACARCHGDADASPASRLIPRLSGQKAVYLKRALKEYAIGARFSGIMQPIAAELEANDIENLAEFYSSISQQEAPTPRPEAEPDLIERGRRIAVEGVAAAGIPACFACHGAGTAEMFPRLEGQHAPYVAAQLRAFRDGRRGRTTTGAIMETVARRLGEDEIAAVAGYLASIPTARIGRSPLSPSIPDGAAQ